MRKRWIKKVQVVIAFIVLAFLAVSSTVMLLWNNTLPAIFHMHTITFWQAGGILLLSKLLFGGFKGRRGMGGWHWKKRMADKWQHMTEEEKEKFSERMQCRKRYAAE